MRTGAKNSRRFEFLYAYGVSDSISTSVKELLTIICLADGVTRACICTRIALPGFVGTGAAIDALQRQYMPYNANIVRHAVLVRLITGRWRFSTPFFE